MNKQQGFTIIELLIVIAVIAIVGLVINGVINGPRVGDTMCRGGYTYMVTEVDNGQPELEQMRDNDGKGIPCQG